MLRISMNAWLAVMLTAASISAAVGQNYPYKPIRMLSGEAESGGDITGRLIGQKMASSLGQPMIMDNRGGSIVIPTMMMVKAAPDGYTVLLYAGSVWLLPFLQDGVPYDPVRDFSPITLASSSPNVVVVNPLVEARSIRELIALAKAKPGGLNYSSSTIGSSSHLAGALFNSMAGVNIQNIPYKGSGPAAVALVGGEVQVMFSNTGVVTPHLKAGRVRALAVTSAQPSALLPDLPTVAASGLPGYEVATIFGIFAPAKTPSAIINKLNQEMVRALRMSDVKEKLLSVGIDAIGSSPAELASTMKADMARMGTVIKTLGIRAN